MGIAMKYRGALLSGLFLLTMLAGCSKSDDAAESGMAAGTEESVVEEIATPETDSGSGFILVTGATGTQGGAVARELLSRGYSVHGLTRNPNSERAQAIAALGVVMVKGDYDDPASLAAAMDGAYGVFAVTDFWEHGYDQEVEHGENLVDAAAGAGVGHFVYTSVAGGVGADQIPHFASKFEVEEYLEHSRLPYTIIRPVEFMDNWRYAKEQFLSGRFIDPRSAQRTHQWIAASDIGFFVGEAFDNPDAWIGQIQEIAGDQMPLYEFASLLSDLLDRPIVYQQISWDDYMTANGEEMAVMTSWFDEVGYSVDVRALREQYPNLVTAEEFLSEMDWND